MPISSNSFSIKSHHRHNNTRDDSALKIDSLPAPIPLVQQDSWGGFFQGQLEVSSQHTHAILWVSKCLTNLLGYSDQQICGQNIAVICGSDEEHTRLLSLINASLASTSKECASYIKLCGASGKQLHVKAACTVECKREDSGEPHCRIRIEPAFAAGPLPFKRHLTTESSLANQQSPYRRQYNFYTGLEVHRALLRRERAATRSSNR